jgi:hypothetical protein
MPEDVDLASAIARDLGVVRNSIETRSFEHRVKEWADEFKPFENAVRESAVVSEKDLAIRINVRDYD